MSHPLRAVLLALLLAAGASATSIAAAAPADTAFEPAAVRGTSFTDALVPPSAELLAQADLQDICADGQCAAGSDAAALAVADTRTAATASPAAAPVRTGIDGKPAGIGSVPEPQTYALLCSGLCLIGLGARTSRRRRQSE